MVLSNVVFFQITAIPASSLEQHSTCVCACGHETPSREVIAVSASASKGTSVIASCGTDVTGSGTSNRAGASNGTGSTHERASLTEENEKIRDHQRTGTCSCYDALPSWGG
ncbi:hypothetical protein F4604DRAFT_874634 [Suillus subluteus]|nr:hypothetical protein F4604DRAFT_874634 [Suillus subluteus]